MTNNYTLREVYSLLVIDAIINTPAALAFNCYSCYHLQVTVWQQQ